ncbi:amphi-Trp domain-containing protein [Halorubrum sp. LN27]|uniref:amphi-Trp domain-containing protein n=1 Tax=Halorubrum sp. LN27 TaxID=2801032 RepID=UPI00190D2ACE|nr:amphi-Trp domain-containing protein [Halorubrum sp. LN27]
MTERDEYEREVTGDREEIASILSGVADGVRAGAVRIGDGDDAVTVETPDEFTLEIELETEDDETSLELELEWSASSDASAVSSDEETADETDEARRAEKAGEARRTERADETEDTDEADGNPALAEAADGTQSLARFEVYRGRDGEWRWRLRHRNGNIIATGGEGYTRKHNALKGLRSVMANSPDAAVADEFEDASGA